MPRTLRWNKSVLIQHFKFRHHQIGGWYAEDIRWKKVYLTYLAWFPSTFGDWVWIDWDWHHSYCHHKLHSQPRTAQHYELPKRQNWRNGIGRKLKRQKESQTCCSFEKSRRNSELGSLIWKKNLLSFLCMKLTFSNLPNNRVGPFNHVGGRFLRNQ